MMLLGELLLSAELVLGVLRLLFTFRRKSNAGSLGRGPRGLSGPPPPAPWFGAPADSAVVGAAAVADGCGGCGPAVLLLLLALILACGAIGTRTFLKLDGLSASLSGPYPSNFMKREGGGVEIDACACC